MYAVVMKINTMWDEVYLARTHATIWRKRCLWLKQEVACIQAAAKEVKLQVSPMSCLPGLIPTLYIRGTRSGAVSAL